MKVAAVQMKAVLGDVEANLKTAARISVEAFKAGAELVVLPEFFTSAVGFHPSMLDVALPIDGKAAQFLKDTAIEYNGIIGGSFISIRGSDRYNTWMTAFPDGSIFCHDKDIPTMIENCYYTGGNDDGVFETPIGRLGVAMCWEFIRTSSLRRMLNRVDLVIGGSCWWTLPEKKLPGFTKRLEEKNLEIMIDTPQRFAKTLGVPVIHAAHAGEFTSAIPMLPGVSLQTHYLGETCIVDGAGNVIKRMKYEDGEGFVIADLDLTVKHAPSLPIPDGYWIPDLPARLKFVWRYQNIYGKIYYRLPDFLLGKRK